MTNSYLIRATAERYYKDALASDDSIHLGKLLGLRVAMRLMDDENSVLFIQMLIDDLLAYGSEITIEVTHD